MGIIFFFYEVFPEKDYGFIPCFLDFQSRKLRSCLGGHFSILVDDGNGAPGISSL
jgi:hypothetical protein